MGVGVEEKHTGSIQSWGNSMITEQRRAKKDLGSGEEDLGGGAEEDVGDLGDFSESGSSRNSRDDNIVEGAMVLGGGIELQHLWRGMWQIQRLVKVKDVRLSIGQLLQMFFDVHLCMEHLDCPAPPIT